MPEWYLQQGTPLITPSCLRSCKTLQALKPCISSHVCVPRLAHTCLCMSPVCREQSLAAAQQDVQQQLGGAGLNLLVNNAGVGLVAPAEFVPLQQWRQVLDVNLQGPLAVTQVNCAGQHSARLAHRFGLLGHAAADTTQLTNRKAMWGR